MDREIYRLEDKQTNRQVDGQARQNVRQIYRLIETDR